MPPVRKIVARIQLHLGIHNFHETNFQDVIDCLKTIDAHELSSKEQAIAEKTGLGFQPFVPTADGNLIKLEPKELLPRVLDMFSKTPILLGTNKMEGSKAAMYFDPEMFPYTDSEDPVMKKDSFKNFIQKSFPKKSKWVSHAYILALSLLTS